MHAICCRFARRPDHWGILHQRAYATQAPVLLVQRAEPLLMAAVNTEIVERLGISVTVMVC
jgi:hypothetical protein